MNSSASQKLPRIRVKPTLYAKLRHEVLERDGWRCQQCGSLSNLDVHHVRRRSSLGDDAEANLITLCRDCHRILHTSAFSRARRTTTSVTSFWLFQPKT
jgi:5-methylcytosine-specific restriction endonuclease McrA